MVQRRAKVIQCFLKNGETGDDPYAHDAVLCRGQDTQKGFFLQNKTLPLQMAEKVILCFWKDAARSGLVFTCPLALGGRVCWSHRSCIFNRRCATNACHDNV